MSTSTDRIAALARLGDAELTAECVTAIELHRAAKTDPGRWQDRERCWAACVESRREYLWYRALDEIRRREANKAKTNEYQPTPRNDR